MTTSQLAAAAANIRNMANAAHAAYPQYRDHWDGPEWQLATITRRVRTKMGVAFERGDITLVKLDRGIEFATAYSIRNRIDTSVPRGSVRVLA